MEIYCASLNKIIFSHQVHMYFTGHELSQIIIRQEFNANKSNFITLNLVFFLLIVVLINSINGCAVELYGINGCAVELYGIYCCAVEFYGIYGCAVELYGTYRREIV